MKKDRSDLLASVDAALAGVDDALRAAQDVKLRAAVDELIESAAPEVHVHPLLDYTWIEHLPEVEAIEDRQQAIYFFNWSLRQNGDGWDRVCNNDCYDSVEDEWYDCEEFELEVEHDGLIGPCIGMVINTPNNRDVFEDPPDGVPPGEYYLDNHNSWDPGDTEPSDWYDIPVSNMVVHTNNSSINLEMERIELLSEPAHGNTYAVTAVSWVPAFTESVADVADVLQAMQRRIVEQMIEQFRMRDR